MNPFSVLIHGSLSGSLLKYFTPWRQNDVFMELLRRRVLSGDGLEMSGCRLPSDSSYLEKINKIENGISYRKI